MGGTFSGCRDHKKRAVEACHAIDTADLKRWHLLRPGITRSGDLEWRRGNEEKVSAGISYTVAITDGSGTFRVEYQIGDPPTRFDYPVRLVTTGCHLGGIRWWFLCPLSLNGVGCGQRVRKLYLRGNYFGCRHCHKLAYRSSQESDSRVYAALRRGAHLERAEDLRGMSVSQLGFSLKVLTVWQKKLDRYGKRLDRMTGKSAKGNVEQS